LKHKEELQALVDEIARQKDVVYEKEQKIAELSTEIDREQQADVEIEKRIEELQERVLAAEASKTQGDSSKDEKIVDLLSQLGSLEQLQKEKDAENHQRFAELQQEIDQGSHSTALDDKNKQIEELQARVNDLETAKKQLTVKDRAIEMLIGQNNELQKENQEVEQKSTKQIAEKTKQIEELQAKIQEFDGSHQATNGKGEQLETLIKEKEALQAEIAQLKVQNDAKLGELRTQLDNLEQSKKQLEIEKGKIISDLEAEVDQFRLKQKNVDTEKEKKIEDLQTQLDTQDAQYQKVSTDFSILKEYYFTWVILAMKYDRLIVKKVCNINSALLYEKIMDQEIPFPEWPSFIKMEIDKPATPFVDKA